VAHAARESNVPDICGIDAPERAARVRSEQRLLLAVLREAVLTFQRCVDSRHYHDRRLFREVTAWFDSNDTTSIFAFLPLCDALGLEPAYLRWGLQRWRDARPVLGRSPRRLALRLRG